MTRRLTELESLGGFEKQARIIVGAAVDRYVARRRRMVPGFADRYFGFIGAARLHRHAFGWDMVRAPVNVVLALPQVVMMAAAWGARSIGRIRAADWLAGRRLFLTTNVAAEIQWLLYTELLELPIEQKRGKVTRYSPKDALWDEIFADASVDDAVRPYLQQIGCRADNPEFRERLTDMLKVYVNSRNASAEIATAFLTATTGAIGTQQVTLSAFTLGPALGIAWSQHAAIASFPLGIGLGGIWYNWFPVSTSIGVVLLTTTAVLAVGSITTAFAGIITDPVQRKLGLHQKRLIRIVNSVKTELTGGHAERFAVRDHYVARLIDTVDIVRSVGRWVG